MKSVCFFFLWTERYWSHSWSVGTPDVGWGCHAMPGSCVPYCTVPYLFAADGEWKLLQRRVASRTCLPGGRTPPCARRTHEVPSSVTSPAVRGPVVCVLLLLLYMCPRKLLPAGHGDQPLLPPSLPLLLLAGLRGTPATQTWAWFRIIFFLQNKHCSTFVYIRQILSNYRLIRFKRFVSQLFLYIFN